MAWLKLLRLPASFMIYYGLYKSYDISLVMLEGSGFAYDVPKSVSIN